MKLDELWAAPPSVLARALAEGHPIDADALPGSYRGVSLGLPRWVDRIAWKLFRKRFVADGGRLHGHNERVIQSDGPLAPVRVVGPPAARMDRHGAPVLFGPFEVAPLAEGDPFGCRAGLLLDYGAAHPVWHPLGRLRDPLVALEAGSVEVLLGASYLAMGRHGIRTPSFFTLEREGWPQ